MAAEKAVGREERSALSEVLRPVAGGLRAARLLSAVGAAAGVVPFVALGQLADRLPGLASRDLAAVAPVVWLVLAGLAVRGSAGAAALVISHHAGVHLQSALRRRLVDHLARVPLSWFSEHSSGQVRAGAQDDVDELHQVVAHHPVEAAAAWTGPLVAVAYLAVLDWRLAVLALVAPALYALAYARMVRGYAGNAQRLAAGASRVSAAVVELVHQITVVKAFGPSGRAHRRYTEATRTYAATFEAWVRPLLRTESLATAVVSAPVVLVIACAGVAWFVSAGLISPGEGLTGLLAAVVVPSTITALGAGASRTQSARAAALRVQQLLATPVLPVPQRPAPPSGHRIQLDAVRFAYPGGPEVIRGVDLDCPEGTLTALVGSSGAGKSTLAALIARFHDVTEGAVRIGGVDVRDLDPEELHRHVGVVLQDVQLLRATVADNVRLGRPGASDEEVRAACRAARIHDCITALPRGYDAVVGEDAALSGGEVQRVAVARALLADTPVLVLDEATSFADSVGEAELQDALSELARGRTVVVVAHRLSTVVGADRIAVLDAGCVEETGTHAELLARAGRYAALWRAHHHEEDVA